MTEIKPGDTVKHKLKNKKYIVLKVKTEEKSILEGIGELLSGEEKGDLYCMDENKNKGYLYKEEVEKVK